MPMTRAEGISNAFQKELAGELRTQVISALSSSPVLREAVHCTFGTERYVVPTAKILMTEFGAAPQAMRP